MEKTFKIKTRFEYSDANKTDIEPIGCENIYLTGTLYEKLFGRPLKGSDRRKRFLKITSLQTGSSVYRLFRGAPTGVVNKDILYIDSDGKAVLQRSDDEVVLSIKKCCPFSFYWNTSNSATRISFKIGLPSLIIGAASLILTIVFYFLGK